MGSYDLIKEVLLTRSDEFAGRPESFRSVSIATRATQFPKQPELLIFFTALFGRETRSRELDSSIFGEGSTPGIQKKLFSWQREIGV